MSITLPNAIQLLGESRIKKTFGFIRFICSRSRLKISKEEAADFICYEPQHMFLLLKSQSHSEKRKNKDFRQRWSEKLIDKKKAFRSQNDCLWQMKVTPSVFFELIILFGLCLFTVVDIYVSPGMLKQAKPPPDWASYFIRASISSCAAEYLWMCLHMYSVTVIARL